MVSLRHHFPRHQMGKTPTYPPTESESSEEEDTPYLLITVVALGAVCGTLVLVVLWNRFCRRRREHSSRQGVDIHEPPPYGFPNFLHQPHRHHVNPVFRHDEPTVAIHREHLRHVRNDDNESESVQGNRSCACQSAAVLNPEVDFLNRVEHSDIQRSSLSPAPCLPTFPHSMCALSEHSARSSTKKVCNKQVVSVSRRVTCSGDCLPLDNMGIMLEVPPGAVKPGEEKLITLVLDWDLNDNPEMTEEQSLVSPVVYVGPHNLQLDKPCTLRYKHCAYDWRHIRVMRSETDLLDIKDWQTMCDKVEESDVCCVTSDEVRLTIHSFTLFTCIQRPVHGLKMGKWLQLAVFSYPLKSNIHHHQVRVYFLNKTPCALQWAIQNEATFGGKLLCPEKAFLFYGNDEDIRVNLRYLSDKWEKVDDDDYDRVQYLHIWHGKCPHVSMCFRKKDPGFTNKELNFSLYVYQDTLDNEGEKLVVHATEGLGGTDRDGQSCSKHNDDHSTVIVNFGPDHHSNVKVKKVRNESESCLEVFSKPDFCVCNFDSILDNSFFPHSVKTDLKHKLDPECPMGNNWKGIVERLGYNHCIDYIHYLRGSGKSPTEIVLALAEKNGKTMEDIKEILIEMRRMDAVKIIDDYLSKKVEHQRQDSLPTCSLRSLVPIEHPMEHNSTTGFNSELRAHNELHSTKEEKTLNINISQPTC